MDDAQIHALLSRGREEGPADDSDAKREMRANRRIASRKNGSAAVSLVSGRIRDPMFYWQQSNLPYDTRKNDDLAKIRKWCRQLYQTHPVFGAAVDIFSKFPLVGMELFCKDEELTEFYNTLFFDRLKYRRYLIRVLREYWCVGESWPFGSFNELLGVWEDDELLDPDDIEVTKSPFMTSPRFRMKLPKVIRDLLNSRDPAWEYDRLIKAYPEFSTMGTEETWLPVSDVLLKQLAFDMDPFIPRGVPIMMRGLRAAIQEEMLNAAQESVASRLYTPLILARLGATASELGTERPWIPSDEDLAEFEAAVDAALAGDFRMLTYHFGVKMDSVFGRENMPRLDMDFERLTERILMVFGLSKTMLVGASSGQTYAADALNRDLVSQLLTDAQELIKDFFHERALVVAEAQEHYDYVERGGKRYPIMEEVLEVDENGNQRIVEQPKLLVPELRIRQANLRDEETQRQFFEALRAAGVPISMKTRLVNVPVDLEDERASTIQEQVDQAVDAGEARKRTYLTLLARGLPIPQDLKEDFEPRVDKGEPAPDPFEQFMTEEQGLHVQPDQARLPSLGLDTPIDDDALTPDLRDPRNHPHTVRLPRGRIMDNPGVRNHRQRPPESDEARVDMPRPKAARLEHGPRHIGMRRYATVEKAPTEDEH